MRWRLFLIHLFFWPLWVYIDCDVLLFFVVDICGHVYALVFFGLSLVQFKRGRVGPGAGGVWSFVFRPRKKKKKKNLGECYTMCNDWTWIIPAHVLSLSAFMYQGRDLDPTGNPCGDMLWDNVKWRSLYCNVWSVPTTYKLTSRSRHRVVNSHSL